jgi:hypothetical protein
MAESKTEIEALSKIRMLLENKVSKLKQKIERIKKNYMQEHKEMPQYIREIATGNEARIELAMKSRLEDIIKGLETDIKASEEDYDSYYRGMKKAEEKLTEV